MDAEDVCFSKFKKRLWGGQPFPPSGKLYAENIICEEAIVALMFEVKLKIADPIFSNC